MTRCLICKEVTQPFADFGKQPLGNGFLNSSDFKSEYFFPLEVCFCPQCAMVQLAEQPQPEKMFNENYAFFSGTSKLMGIHFQSFYEFLRTRYDLNGSSFVVELGSNDGILLQNFVQNQIPCLGIDPSENVAEVARQKGVPTWTKFFSPDVATDVVNEHGQADAFVGANVMCHIPDLHSVIRGIDRLLKPKGVIAFEDPYLGDVLEKTSYDQIYDEHVFLFSALSIKHLFGMHGFELIDVVPQSVHGGSMRYILARKGVRVPSASVGELLEKEKARGLLKPETYQKFALACEASRLELRTLLETLKKEGKRVVGYAATSKSTTVINYCNLDDGLVEFISDTTPIKQGKFSPGKHIPVLSPENFRNRYPDYALLFGWNHQKEILAKEKDFTAAGGKWIVYVPKVTVVSG